MCSNDGQGDSWGGVHHTRDRSQSQAPSSQQLRSNQRQFKEGSPTTTNKEGANPHDVRLGEEA